VKAPSYFNAPADCTVCGGTMTPLKNGEGQYLAHRTSVVPANGKHSGGIVLGGPNFLTGFKVCGHCGHTQIFNLTTIGLDPACSAN